MEGKGVLWSFVEDLRAMDAEVYAGLSISVETYGDLWSAMQAYGGLCRSMETLMKAYGDL